MAILPLTKFPNPLLREVSLVVGEIDDDIRRFAQDMLDTMYEEGGVGIAAVQVGRLLRIAAIDVNYRDGDREPMIAINPEIVESSDEQSSYDEGCLSVGRYRGSVSRPARVTVRYIDLEGKERQIEADGILATCLQHEIDHMDGVMFLDHLTEERRQEILDQLAAEETPAAEGKI
ncbi:peptide deformylase [Brucella intermedia]|uniref:peptide deformylase n=1 Tax=Brucella intermedia TaxID=94625 RepID=UPI00235FDABD|nr:peptide deformylase [Brucella intermedia]